MANDESTSAEASVGSLRSEENGEAAPGIRQMLVLLGANLLLFNQIEIAFKRVLRDLRPVDGRFDGDALATILHTLEKQPLGNVAKLLTALFDPGKVAGFAAYIAEVVERRNQVVHHFLEVPGVSLIGSGPEFAAGWLKTQLDFCLPLKRMAEQLLVSHLYELERVAASRGEELVVEEWRTHWQ